MPTSPYALARERLKTIAEDETNFAGKCALLPQRDFADVEFWRRFTPGNSIFLAVCESALAPGDFETPGSIALYLYAETGAGAQALDDLLAQLRALYIDADNFPTGELACTDVSFESAEIISADPARPILRARLTCFFPAF